MRTVFSMVLAGWGSPDIWNVRCGLTTLFLNMCFHTVEAFISQKAFPHCRSLMLSHRDVKTALLQGLLISWQSSTWRHAVRTLSNRETSGKRSHQMVSISWNPRWNYIIFDGLCVFCFISQSSDRVGRCIYFLSL